MNTILYRQRSFGPDAVQCQREMGLTLRRNVMQASSNNRKRKLIVLLFLCSAMTGIVVLITLTVRGGGAQGIKKMRLSVQDPRPVAKAIEILEARYGWVITYEDPRYVHDSEITDVTRSVRRDLNKFRTGGAPRVLIPRGGALTVDYDVATATNAPSDRATVIQQLLDAQAASGNPGRFRLERNGQIVHVIPAFSKNSAGELVPEEPVLDAVITVPAGDRTGMQKLDAICEAISQVTQTRVVVGVVPLNLFFQHRDQQGAVSQKARDALAQILEAVGNGTSLSWQLLYDPGMRIYVLNIHEVPKTNR